MKRTPLARKTELRGTPAARLTSKTRAKKQGPKHDPAEKETRRIVAARSGGMCEICGVKRAESMHHRKNRSQGGPWSPSNIVHLDGDGTTGCHGIVTNTRPEYYSAGWCVKGWQVPAEVPVLTHFGWVLLDDHGCFTPSLPFEDRAA
jgi:hypothetical protein